jgi:hypothetical protein
VKRTPAHYSEEINSTTYSTITSYANAESIKKGSDDETLAPSLLKGSYSNKGIYFCLFPEFVRKAVEMRNYLQVLYVECNNAAVGDHKNNTITSFANLSLTDRTRSNPFWSYSNIQDD